MTTDYARAMQVINAPMPQAPIEIQDEVELWARKSGRHATMHFIPVGGWFAIVSLHPHDPRMRAYQEGMAEEPPGEQVWFHKTVAGRPGDFEGMDILQMGPSGVRTFLEKGDTWSGRGEFRSVEQAARKAADHNVEQREKDRLFQREENRNEQRAKRRWRLGIPYLSVLSNIGSKAKKED